MYIITAYIEQYKSPVKRTFTIESETIQDAIKQIPNLISIEYIYREDTTISPTIINKEKLNTYNNAPINTETKEIDKIKKVLKDNWIKFFAWATLLQLRSKLIDNNLKI